MFSCRIYFIQIYGLTDILLALGTTPNVKTFFISILTFDGLLSGKSSTWEILDFSVVQQSFGFCFGSKTSTSIGLVLDVVGGLVLPCCLAGAVDTIGGDTPGLTDVKQCSVWS